MEWTIRATNWVRTLFGIGRGTLMVGRGGERWIVQGPVDVTPYRPLAGVAARELLPEPAVAALRRAGTSILFVSDSGSTYLAREPLGDFEVRKSTIKLRATSASANTIVSFDGESIVRSSDGVLWMKAKPLHPGKVVATAMTPSGRGLARLETGALLTTDDDGQSWRAVGSPPMPVDLLDAADEHLFAGQWELGPADHWTYQSGHQRLHTVHVGTAQSGWLSEPADAVDYGFQALSEDRVYSFAAVDEADETPPFELRLERRRLGEVAPAASVAEMSCDDATVAASGDTVEVLCLVGDIARLRRSDDAGSTWRDDGEARMGPATDPVPNGPPRSNMPFEDHRVFLGPGGALLVGGGCPASGVCSTVGVVRTSSGTAFDSARVDVAHARFGAVRFAGKRVYAIGSYGEVFGRMGALFTSEDGGRSFSHLKLGLTTTLTDDSSFYPDRGSIVVDPQGEVVRVAIVEGAFRLGAYEKVGGTWKPLPPPPGLPDFAGLRGLTSSGAETNDGGRTWTQRVGPTGRAHCSETGCIVASVNDRVGWHLPKKAP